MRNSSSQGLGGNGDRKFLLRIRRIRGIGNRNGRFADANRSQLVGVIVQNTGGGYAARNVTVLAGFRYIVAPFRAFAIDQTFRNSGNRKTGIFFFDDLDVQLQDEEFVLSACDLLYAGVGRLVVVDLQAERDGCGLARVVLCQAALEVQRQCTICLVKGRRRTGDDIDITCDNSVGSHPVLVVRIIEDFIRQTELAERNIHTGRCVADFDRMRIFASAFYDDGEHLQCSALNIRVIFIKLVILSVLVF